MQRTRPRTLGTDFANFFRNYSLIAGERRETRVRFQPIGRRDARNRIYRSPRMRTKRAMNVRNESGEKFLRIAGGALRGRAIPHELRTARDRGGERCTRASRPPPKASDGGGHRSPSRRNSSGVGDCARQDPTGRG